VYVLGWQESEVVVEFYNRGDFGGFKFPNTLNFTMAVFTTSRLNLHGYLLFALL
jgi:hypothetical protein